MLNHLFLYVLAFSLFRCLPSCIYSASLNVNSVYSTGEQGMVDEAQKALEEAEALRKVTFSY